MTFTIFRKNPILSVFLFLFLIIVCLSLFNRFFFAPKILLLCVTAISAVLLGKGKSLFRDWFVFFSFIYLFDSLRGTIYILTCKLGLPVHVNYVIKLDEWLFNQVPSISLQGLLLPPEGFSWFEKFLTVVHGTHFIAFLFIGTLIWLNKSDSFARFKSSFYWVTFLGVGLYFIVPTAPPWIASEVFGRLPEIVHFNNEIYTMTIPDLTAGFATNPIAAMPSLHAAFPVLCCFILWNLYRGKGFPFYLYTAIMLFTIVYTGDHYIVDIVVGGLLAGICFLIGFKSDRIPAVARMRAFLLKGGSSLLKTLRQPLVVGGLLLGLGIGLGISNKAEFNSSYEAYDYATAPRYVDFFKNADAYRDNFQVQYYLGKYHRFHNHKEKARMYFEQALQASQDYSNTKTIQRELRDLGFPPGQE